MNIFYIYKIINPLIRLPTPLRISLLWNMGFILGVILLFQVLTGLFLSINYIPYCYVSFDSVVHIIRDINYGWFIRFSHIRGASILFIFIYLHILRGIYFNRAIKISKVWISGILILLICIGTSFLGYVLPWGQISFWGATVITSIISAIPYIGNTINLWLWGNFSVSQPTLNRFFSLHFLIPIFIVIIIILHLIILHNKGSSNPLGLITSTDKIKFFPFFIIKDAISLRFVIIFIFIFITINPNLFGDEENYNIVNPLSTPVHIQPEWYFLFAYAILRSIPSKLGGVFIIIISIIILIIMMIKKKRFNINFNIIRKINFRILVSFILILTWLGANPVEYPFLLISQFISFLYFLIFLVIFSYSLK